jgi:hypothetical protein
MERRKVEKQKEKLPNNKIVCCHVELVETSALVSYHKLRQAQCDIGPDKITSQTSSGSFYTGYQTW